MDQTTVSIVITAGLFLLLALGFPIAQSLLAIGMVGLLLTQGWASADYLIGNFPYTTSAQFAFVVIPLFLFMGHMAYSAGISEKAFRAAKAWFGHVPGGLAIASVASCAGFATVSGSSIATAATIGRIAIPEMLRAGYSQRLAGGCVATGGTLGVLIPPSGILVVYSIATEVPIPELFTAALVPGLLTAAIYGIGIYLMVRLDPKERTATIGMRQPWGVRFRLLFGSWEILLLFGVVMGTLYTGIATATEAAAFGALAALVVALMKRTRLATVRHGLRETGVATASIFFLIIGAGVFSLALATTQVPQQASAFAAALDLSPTVLLLLLLLPYLLLGCFIDAISMILLTMPVVFPIVIENNIDPVLFGILVTKMTEVGNITPPVGLNVFVVKSTSPKLELDQVFRGVLPFFAMEILLVLLLVLLPDITLFAIRD